MTDSQSPKHLTVTRHLWAHDNRRALHPGGAFSPRPSRKTFSTSNYCLPSSASSSSSAATAAAEEYSSMERGGESPVTQGPVESGPLGLHHRRRRLILKAVNRSWPTSGSASASSPAAAAGCDLVTGAVRTRSVNRKRHFAIVVRR